MLTSGKARVNGPLFVAAGLIRLGIVGATAGGGRGRQRSKSGSPASWVSWVKIALERPAAAGRGPGVPAAVPPGGEEPQTPKWMATIDRTARPPR